jgi:hypothetical protein
MHAAEPMWRNGRRNGLKIRWAEKARAGSSPAIGTSQNAVWLGKIVGFAISLIANGRARKRTE